MTCGLSSPLSSVWMWNVCPLYLTLLLNPTWARTNDGRISRSTRMMPSSVQRAMAWSRSAVFPGDPLHPLEGELRDAGRRIDAERLGEQVLPFDVVRAVGRPGREHCDRFVRAAFVEQPLGDAGCGRARLGRVVSHEPPSSSLPRRRRKYPLAPRSCKEHKT